VASPDDDQLPPALATLQEATLQLLGAAKLFIAAAEQVVADPKSIGRIGAAMNDAVVDLVRVAGRIVTPKAAREDPDDGLEHIDLSG
jgi:hypothetical protein